MAKKVTNIKERILQAAKCKGISLEKFFSDMGLKYGNFRGKAKSTPLNSEALAIILTNHPDLNVRWLLLGEGLILEQYQEKDTSETADLVSQIEFSTLKDKYLTILEENRSLRIENDSLRGKVVRSAS